MKTSVTLATARAEMEAAARQLQIHPSNLRGEAKPHGSRSRHLLVIAQIAMTVVLLGIGQA